MGIGNDNSSTQERRQTILELLLEKSHVTVRELSERFSVSTMTVHRDLDALERRGVLRKVRGGATAQPTGLYESSLDYRLGEAAAEKEEIARAAARHVAPGSSIVMDDSTTALAMLPYLSEIESLTIVTNFVTIVEEVSRMADSSLTLVAVGGTYNAKYHSFVGVPTEQALESLHVDRCFVSVAAVDVRRGAFHQEPEQAAIKRTMIAIADHSTLLADASKFANRALHRIVELDAFDAAIVDSGTDAAIVNALRSGGLEVEVAHPAESLSERAI